MLKKIVGYDYLSSAERKDLIDIETTYGDGKNNSKDQTSKEEKVVGSDNIEYKQEAGKETQEYKQEAEEAKKDPEKEVTTVENPDDPENPTFIITGNHTEEEKAENNNENGSTESDTSWKDMLESENVTVVKPVKEDNKVEDKVEAPAKEDNKTEEKAEAPAKEDNKVENKVEAPAKEDNKVEDKVEAPAKEDNKVETLKVTAVDGYSTFIKSSIQFRISGGDDITIEGLDGIDYSYTNGVLTVNTPSEATVIPVCVSNAAGNSVTFTITVNGIIG